MSDNSSKRETIASYPERVSGNIGEAMIAAMSKATEIGGSSISSHGEAIVRGAKIGLAMAKPMAKAAAYSVPAMMEVANRQHGNPAGNLSNTIIGLAIQNARQSSNTQTKGDTSGIASYINKVSAINPKGVSSETSKNSSPRNQSNGSSVGQSKGSGQGR